MINENPYRAAGTFDGLSYIEREADRELLKEIIKNNRYLYFLAPRQSGKSSLISHIRKKLDGTRFKSVFIDLSTFPADCLQSEKAFNEHLVNLIVSAFNFAEEPDDKKDLKKVLEKIVKKEDRRILIFVDEIDRILHSNFKDSWFGLIRSFFNSRANDPGLEFGKLQFILSGAATVTSLISNKIMSPFNVGKSIELYDFSYQQTVEITRHLEKGDWKVTEDVAGKIYDFTSGTLYLTQSVLEKLWEMAIDGEVKIITGEDVEKITGELISKSPNDIHFSTIYESIIDEPGINKLFVRIIEGDSLTKDDEEGMKRLRITGILNEKNLYRNHIYKEVFDVNGPLSLFRNEIISIEYFCISRPGRRPGNEDKALCAIRANQKADNIVLLAVADGMSGLEAGEVASKTVNDVLIKLFKGGLSLDLQQTARRIEIYIKGANNSIYAWSRQKKDIQVGTTVSGAVVINNRCLIFNVGDSRTYIINAGGIKQLTVDHSVDWQSYEEGIIKKEDIGKGRYSNALTRSVGTYPDVKVDIFPGLKLNTRDILFSCTDGLWNKVTDAEIKGVFDRYRDIKKALESLYKLAYKKGSKGNISMAACRYVAGGYAAEPYSDIKITPNEITTGKKTLKDKRKIIKLLLIILLIIFMLLVGILIALKYVNDGARTPGNVKVNPFGVERTKNNDQYRSGIQEVIFNLSREAVT